MCLGHVYTELKTAGNLDGEQEGHRHQMNDAKALATFECCWGTTVDGLWVAHGCWEKATCVCVSSWG